MIGKRGFLAGLLPAALYAGKGGAQAVKPLRCDSNLEIGPGVFCFSSLPVFGPEKESVRQVATGYGRVLLQIDYEVSRSDGYAVGRRKLYLELNQPEGTRRTQIRMSVSATDCPTTTCGEDEEIQARYRLDGQHFLRDRFTRRERKRLALTERPTLLSREQELALRNAGVLWIEVATRAGWERGEISARNIDSWLKRGEQFHRDRLRQVLREGKTCQIQSAQPGGPGFCYITTMIAHRMGRGVESFEVRMMNRLQPRFAAYADHIQAYVRDARHIGTRRDERHVRVGLGLFYLLFIWPAALLIWLGAIWPGAIWYFIGFNILKLLTNFWPSGTPTP